MGQVKELWHEEICAQNKFNLEEAEHEMEQEEYEQFSHNEAQAKERYK